MLPSIIIIVRCNGVLFRAVGIMEGVSPLLPTSIPAAVIIMVVIIEHHRTPCSCICHGWSPVIAVSSPESRLPYVLA
jgi:hypothetical protein